LNIEKHINFAMQIKTSRHYWKIKKLTPKKEKDLNVISEKLTAFFLAPGPFCIPPSEAMMS